jgi:putative ATP-binding cassette transporter
MNWLPMLGRAKVALQKVESLGLSLADIAVAEESVAAAVTQPSWKSLELLGVTHAYHREKESSTFLLGPINLTIHSGEIIFLIGGNGSGKTTLVKLLTGLYRPEEGAILLDGKVVDEEHYDDYQQNFSVVFSDFYLFEKIPGLTSAELEAQHLNHKVKIKDGVLSTIALSQGERKRLALLAAYLENRPFYVFDEWASDQDPLFKGIFYEEILAELKARGKTVLVVSHDDRYFHLADRLVKLDYGEIDLDQSIYTRNVAALSQVERY